MFTQLEKIVARPEPFEVYTADILWTDEHIATQMLSYHLHPEVDAASRNHEFIEQSAAWMIQRFDLSDGKHVIDFGCGPGLYTQRFARSGAKVTGVDFSINSLNYARQQMVNEGMQINYVHQSYFDYDGDEKADLITMIMCDFCAMSVAQRSLMLGKFEGLLNPDGKILLDAYSLHAFDKKEESSSLVFNHMDGFWSKGPYYAFVNVFKYEDVKVSLDKYTLVEENRTREVYNWLQYFSKEQIEKEFEAAGLRIIRWMGNVGGTEYDETADEFAVIAERV
jgi:cyclopropane fatty-acyl-phospholipid synthase-like methyltransferase